MRYVIYDSHRNLSKIKRQALIDFFEIAKSLKEDDALGQVELCEWYEHEYAVSWFETVVFDGAKVVAFLRCLRYPENLFKWYIGDVYVLESYRKQHIASKMYQKTIEEVKRYEAAEKLVVSVHDDNAASIALHEKLGFENTHKMCDLTQLYFDENETAYELTLIKYLPIYDDDLAIRSLMHLWKEYKQKVCNGAYNEMNVRVELIKLVENKETNDLTTIWCGNRLIGFSYRDGKKEVKYTVE